MNIKDLKVVFAGCARDCATFLPDTINNIRSYSKLFKESHTIIVENGSKDKTKEILNQNLRLVISFFKSYQLKIMLKWWAVLVTLQLPLQCQCSTLLLS